MFGLLVFLIGVLFCINIVYNFVCYVKQNLSVLVIGTFIQGQLVSSSTKFISIIFPM